MISRRARSASAAVVAALVRSVATDDPAGVVVAVVSEAPDERASLPGGDAYGALSNLTGILAANLLVADVVGRYLAAGSAPPLLRSASVRKFMVGYEMLAEAQRERDGSGWFEVWLIPETLRMTTFVDKSVGDAVHIEIERSTQVVVDTVRDALDDKLGPLLPVLEAIARERGIELTQLSLPSR